MNYLNFTYRTTARLIVVVMLVAVTTSCRQEASSLNDKGSPESDQGAASNLSEVSSSSSNDTPENDKEGLVVTTEAPVRYGETRSAGPPPPHVDAKWDMRTDITLAPVLPDPILKEIGDTCGDEDVAKHLRPVYIHIRFVSGKRVITGEMCGWPVRMHMYFDNSGSRYDSSFEIESTNVASDKITIIGTTTVSTEVNKTRNNKYVIHTTIEAPGWEQLINQGDLVAEGEATEELNAQIRWELSAQDDATGQN